MQTKTSITPTELNCLLKASGAAVLLDVRTPGEFATGHVPGAQLLPLDDLDPAAFLRQCGTADRPIYVLCQSGGRACKAIEKFQRAGFNGCVLVEGGTAAWIAAGLPVQHEANRGLPLMRQVQIVVGTLTATGVVLAMTVNPRFFIIPLLMGCGLLFAGVTGFCGLALLLAKLPWNRLQNCGSCCTTNR